ncbi:MAG: hypothetical protein WD969_05745 [Paracoccaceae bacterium]
MMIRIPLFAAFIAASVCALPFSLRASEAEIVDAAASRAADGWRFEVTVRHDDSGWDHYADAWRIVGPDGAVYATRTLLHPHQDEQPFTRSIEGVSIPDNVSAVIIEARDNVTGWSGAVLELMLPE